METQIQADLDFSSKKLFFPVKVIQKWREHSYDLFDYIHVLIKLTNWRMRISLLFIICLLLCILCYFLVCYYLYIVLFVQNTNYIRSNYDILIITHSKCITNSSLSEQKQVYNNSMIVSESISSSVISALSCYSTRQGRNH